MAEIVRLPTAGVGQQATIEEIDQQEEPTDRQVWGVCPYLRDGNRCEGCPPGETSFVEGEERLCIRMCRALVEEACRIVMACREGDAR